MKKQDADSGSDESPAEEHRKYTVYIRTESFGQTPNRIDLAIFHDKDQADNPNSPINSGFNLIQRVG